MDEEPGREALGGCTSDERDEAVEDREGAELAAVSVRGSDILKRIVVFCNLDLRWCPAIPRNLLLILFLVQARSHHPVTIRSPKAPIDRYSKPSLSRTVEIYVSSRLTPLKTCCGGN